MFNANEIPAQVVDFLEGRISLDQFEDWSSVYSWNIHKSADEEGRRIAYLIRGILNEHSDDLTEDALRRELADNVCPFASGPVYSPAREIVYGRPLREARSVNPLRQMVLALR